MSRLIKDRAIVDDSYIFASPADDGSLTLPAGDVLVSLATWQSHRDVLLAHPFGRGVQLKADEFAEAISDDLDKLSLVAIEFPAFADGRGYSTAYTLRSRYGYKGELRAVGDVFKDTLFYQQRSGFNAFAVRTDKNIDDALQALDTFSSPYQGTANDPAPLFRRRLA